jgi:NAD(P)-dependent dehydrogenase (short-subunit alcohol dehydrogenase family)
MPGGTLSGQVALVTGASRGIGRAIALHLAAAGAAVALVARSKPHLDEVAGEIRGLGGAAETFLADVSDRIEVESAVAAATARLGPISILVNNAGRAKPFGPIGIVDPDAWWQTQAIHVRGALLFMHAVIPSMRARSTGRIINVASRGGVEVAPMLSAYCVAKAAQIRMTEHVDAEGRVHGIRAFAIQPGTIITDMAHDSMSDPEAQKWTPFLVDHLKAMLDEDPAAGLRRVGEFAVTLASGRFDILSGRYLDIAWDLDALAREATAAAAR